MKKIISFVTTAVMVLSFGAMSSCGIETKQEINNRYSTEAIDLTKITKVNGASFYVSDSFLEKGIEKTTNGYELSSDTFIVKACSANCCLAEVNEITIADLAQARMQKKITVEKIISDDKNDVKAKCLMEQDNTTLSGYIRILNKNIMLLALNESDNSVAETIIDSLSATYDSQQAVYTISDGNLSASVNNIEVGSAVSVDQIENDFANMGTNFNALKEELQYVNGATISNIRNTVELQFNNISNGGNESEQVYLNSISAYNDAITDFNIALNNGINLDSKKEDIEKAFNIDITPEWTHYVIINNDARSKIRSVAFDYIDDTIQALEINNETDTSINTEDTDDSSLDASTQLFDSDSTEAVDSILDSEQTFTLEVESQGVINYDDE
jgi:hypothetical protein